MLKLKKKNEKIYVLEQELSFNLEPLYPCDSISGEIFGQAAEL